MTAAPTIIAGRYTVLRHLGTGGMGAVFLARDERLGREVAVKRVHAGGGADAARRISREAKLGAGLSHPALVTVFDTVVEHANLIIVMEYVDGETLATRLGRDRLTPDDALAVLRPLAAALDHAHAHGIVHRDVKPANVLLGKRGVVKLADLGVALTEQDVSRITREGALIGSLHYMAPEQLDPGRPTPAADIYALAAIAFETLSGRRAREGHTPLALARAAAEDPVPDLRAVAPELPAAAAAVLAAGMAREPEVRPGSAGALIRDLELGLTPKPDPEPAPERTRPIVVPSAPERTVAPPRDPERRRRTPALLGALALLAAAAALVFVLTGQEEDPVARQSTAPRATAGATEPTPAAGAPAPDAPAGADDTSAPAETVRSFYESAAAGDFAAAWALAGPQFRALFGDTQEDLAGTFGTLESIRFTTLETGADGSTVTVETVARHTDRVDRCAGELTTVEDGSGGYLIEGSSISCSSS